MEDCRDAAAAANVVRKLANMHAMNEEAILKLKGVQTNVALAPFTYIKIGGPAKYFLESRSPDDLTEAVCAAQKAGIPYHILGAGSNTLFADHGFAGLVIRVVHDEITWEGATVTVSAGYNLSRLASQAAAKGLAGMEFAMGIPGTVGGAVRGNSGSFHEEIKDVITSVTVLTEDGNTVTRGSAELGYSYRHSIFHDNQEVILSAKLQLRQGDAAEIQALQKQRLEYRRSTQPLSEQTLGSTFKNVPLSEIDESLYAALKVEQFTKTGLVPAGYILESLGLKGFAMGGVKLSEKHANFLINTGLGTAEQVVMLISAVKQKVRVAYKGLQLHEEIQYVGF